jgi:hypothetical protein
MTDERPACPGVHERDAKTVRAETSYSFFGHVLIFMQVTAVPIMVRFRCEVCGRVFDQSSDREVCRKYVAH